MQCPVSEVEGNSNSDAMELYPVNGSDVYSDGLDLSTISSYDGRDAYHAGKGVISSSNGRGMF